jgi:benzoate/toluate 1,2-dioxygenase alpha subunit/2,4,5-trichlorophenoxyacetic acid oxygenase 1
MLITDRPQDGAFSVDRSIFTDEAVCRDELEKIFEGTWVFVGLESQVRERHGFFTSHIGRQPVLITRDADGRIHCFLNSCRHRGAMLCPFKQGRQKVHVCRYHGWSYDSGGHNRFITNQDQGQYPDAFLEADHGLVPVARFEGYRGLLFASLSHDVPPLDEHLGDARRFIDLVVDQSPTGEIEYVPGDISYTFQGNWKLQFENGLDYYHFQSTHSSYVDILDKRDVALEKLPQDDDDQEGQGSFSFANGHAVNWSIHDQDRYGRPLLIDPPALAALRERVGNVSVKWMLRQRNLTIFPNLQIVDIGAVQIRTWRPLSAQKTEMTSHCVGMVGESPAARTRRIRNYEDFFNPSGLATSDDNIMYELCQLGYAAKAAGETQGYSRGLGSPPDLAARHAAELGIAPVESSFGPRAFGGETNFHAGYRHWAKLMGHRQGAQ